MDCLVLRAFLKKQSNSQVRERRLRLTSRHVNIHRDDTVTSPNDRVAVVVVASTVGAAAHADNPARIGHLIVDLAQGGRHLVRQCTSHNHNIGLTRGGTENNSQTILIVTGGGKMHHLDGTAGETEGHRPEGALTGPVGDLVKGGPALESVTKDIAARIVIQWPRHVQDILHRTLLLLLARQRHFLADLAGGSEPLTAR